MTTDTLDAVLEPETQATHTQTTPARRGAVAVVGAGDYIGAAICETFAAEGYRVFGGRRSGEKLAPLKARIEAAGGAFEGRSLDARKEDQVADFIAWADSEQPLEAVIFNVGGNVSFPILETTERVFRKVWEMACQAGFFTGREAARRLLERGGGSIFFTGATASVRGGFGYAAFASAKAGLRALAHSMARELGPQNIHVAHLVIDAGVDTAFVRQRMVDARGAEILESLAPDTLMNPASIAAAYLMLHRQSRDAWTFELDLRPFAETW
jgi:NAD(P)-dependent dehydrogenase (short-subunit alcohol dehydrogenase family)